MPEGLSEDLRQQASMKVGISNYVGSAGLAVIAGLIALYTFILQNYEPSWCFHLLTVVALLVLVVSVVLGGRGANAVADKVGEQSWTATTKTHEFNWQAITTLIGLVLLIIVAFVGNGSAEKPSQPDQLPAHCRWVPSWPSSDPPGWAPGHRDCATR